MTRSKLLAMAGAILVGWLGLARAQEQYPSRLVTIIAPITPGTAIDIMARLYADKLSKRFGQQVVVANRAGAGGMIGAQAVARRGAGRLHGAVRQFRPCDPRRPQQEPAVRSDRRFLRRDAGRRGARHRRGAAFARRFEPQGVRRAGEVEARHDQLRLRRHRHVDASGRRLFRAQGRHRDRARSLYGERDDHRRPARRPHPGLVRADGVRAAAAAGRPAARRWRWRQEPDDGADRDPDREVAGRRLRIRAPGTACSRPARRPSRC